ncbi:MAG TPA: HAD-IIIA family hydrolase [Kiritimatiellia bacterium]|nr:HAD-IIIA family hydrolase [Kiritimatiellia bacterium]
MSKPCIFFDRDGVVNQAPVTRYVETPEAFHILPGFVESLRMARRLGYEAVIVTNQKGVASGKPPVEVLELIHGNLVDHVKGEGLTLTGIYVCSATTDDHPNRKPNPGMLLDAARDHDLSLPDSWMIGDNAKDIVAGRLAGCQTIMVGDRACEPPPDYRVASMDELPGLFETILRDVREGS